MNNIINLKLVEQQQKRLVQFALERAQRMHVAQAISDTLALQKETDLVALMSIGKEWKDKIKNAKQEERVTLYFEVLLRLGSYMTNIEVVIANKTIDNIDYKSQINSLSDENIKLKKRIKTLEKLSEGIQW